MEFKKNHLVNCIDPKTLNNRFSFNLAQNIIVNESDTFTDENGGKFKVISIGFPLIVEEIE